MSKQTAVEWLIEEMILRLAVRIENTFDGNNLLNQAKEMEKEQMISFYLKGCDDTYGIDEPVEGYDRKEAEEYYNETFKNETK